jgi:hypothetical protein
MVYLVAYIKLHPGKVEQFTEVLQHLAPILERIGCWKLLGSYFNSIGRHNTVIDLWELPDANAVQPALDALVKTPEFRKWGR